jgi:uncharacterized membrane protein
MFEHSWHLLLFAALYIGAGLNHFRIQSFYERMIPPYWRYPKFFNLFSGVLEIVFGVMVLLPATQSLAAWGVIGLLVIFLTVHVYMIQERERLFSRIPAWLLWLRLPIQFLLIFWAYLYV